MKDAFGRELKVGDKVAYIVQTGRSATRLEEGTVVGFTETRIKIDYNRCNIIPEKVTLLEVASNKGL
jgi:RNase P/RNase MRP subunit p29